MIGQSVSHYRILEKLGEGGMGVVYKATDTKLDRTVALKFLPDHVAVGSAELERFVQEAKVAAGLNHPNICTIYGIEEAEAPSTRASGPTSLEAKNFIVMEYVDGQTLREKKSSLSIKQAIDVGIQIAEGLAAAHEKGIVHRDIKPENIMFRKDGRVQIMDFGLAKLRGASRLTKEGSTLGTAGYMSPEQVQGQETDYRSDIFSLGVLLYEMLTGQALFKGVHETAIAYEVVNVDTSPPSSVRSEIPPELDVIVLECLEKDPQERTQSAGQVALELKRHRRSSSRSRASMITPARPVASDRGASASPIPVSLRSRIPRWPVMVVVAAVTLAIGYFLSFLRPLERLAEIRRFTWPMDSSLAMLSPDGKRIATVKGHTISIRRFDSMEPVIVESPDDVSCLIWAPSSEYIAYFTDHLAAHELRKVSVNGVEHTTVARMEASSFPRYWGRDDSIVVSTWNNSGLNTLLKVASIGGPLVQMFGGDSSRSCIAGNLSHVMELPDGKSIILSINTGEVNRLVLQSARERKELYIAPRGAFIDKHVYIDGFLIFAQTNLDGTSGYNLWGLPFDAVTPAVTGRAFLVAQNAENVSVSSNGLAAYVQRTGGASGEDLVLLDRTGKTLDLIQRSPVEIHGPSASPLRNLIALGETDTKSGKSDIWLYDVSKKTRSQFSIDIPLTWVPAWSPDGREIVYASGFFDSVNVYLQSTDGFSPAKSLLTGSAVEYAPRFSRDGRTIFFTRRERNSEDSDIWYVDHKDPATRKRLFESRFKEAFAFPSPDGRYITYQSNRSGQEEVYVTNVPEADRQWQISFSGGAYPQWVGDEIFFVSPRMNSLMSATVSVRPTFRAALPKELFSAAEAGVSLHSWWNHKYAVLKGGTQVVAARSRERRSIPKLVIIENWIEELRSRRK